MARATMATLIARLRRLAGDNGGTQTFTDDDLQDVLDGWQIIVRQAVLTPVPNITGLGYVDFTTDGKGSWETGVMLTTADNTVLTPMFSNLITGYFTIATPQFNPIYITGQCYDMAGSAADVCEMWAAQLSRAYDVKDGESDLKRSQMAKSLREQAKVYRAQQGVVQTVATRGDVRRDLYSLYLDERRSF